MQFCWFVSRVLALTFSLFVGCLVFITTPAGAANVQRPPESPALTEARQKVKDLDWEIVTGRVGIAATGKACAHH